MSRRRPALLQHAALALVAYVPLLLTAPGRVAADTKTYLYLDPSKLLSRAASMWDPDTGLGTVTHQTIGYLWPMGPWFWSFEQLGIPDWVAQRLWVGTLLFSAAAGILYLLRTLRVATALPLVGVAAALTYALSPYVLHYAARISVLLLPWAALPWLVALTDRALRSRSWRHPAAFALIVATAGGVNATALVLAGLGPVLWVAFATFVSRDVPWRGALRTTLKIGGLTLACSLWWIGGLAVQGGYGIDILRYTETVETVARTSLSSEVLRGLGYWFFYGGDKLGAWIEPGESYTQHLWLIGVGFVAPAVAIAAAVAVRWRYRAFSVALVLLGTAVAVGAYPYPNPSPLGAVFKAFARSSTAGLALRSTPRAVPLVVLGTTLLVAVGLSALRRRSATIGAVVLALVAAVGIPPLWTGDFIGDNLQRPSEVPAYWDEAAAWLDEQGDDTRVLEVPGTDFASYRWGNTVDPILPGMLDRAYAARELIPYGSEASADLLAALDRRMQEGVFDPEALAPVARLLGVGDVVVRSDLQYERYRTPRPRDLWALLQQAEGFGEPVGFGPGEPNLAIDELPLRDEIWLGIPDDAEDPPEVAALPVRDPLPIVRSRSARDAVLLAGDGEGVVEAAAAGLLGGDGAVLYDAALTPAQRRRALGDGASVLVTDTNRKRARRWSTVRENTGYTERPGEEPLADDPSDNRLPLFPDADDDRFTTVDQRGVRSVQASDYGNPVSYTAEDRPANAFDGDTATAWRTGAFDGVVGERLVLTTDDPVAAARINVVQPITGPRNRFVTRLSVAVDGEVVGTFDLDDRSRTEEGQDLDLGPVDAWSELTLRIEGDNVGKRALYDGFSGVGLAEVRVPGVRVDEVVQLPSALLADSDRAPLTILLSRLRANARELVRNDEERSIVRSFELPSSRSFRLAGEVRVSAAIPDDAVDRLLGASGPAARSSRRLAGNLVSRASSAFDGSPSTAWESGFGEQVGDWLEVDIPEGPISSLSLDVVRDDEHSVPTRFVVSTDRGDRQVATLSNGLLTFPAVAGRTLRLTVDAIEPRITTDWFSGDELVMPVGIAEVRVPGVAPVRVGSLDGACRTDLLEVDGRPVPVAVSGTTAAAVARDGLALAACGGDLRLGEGAHEVRTTLGAVSGFDVDRLVLSDAPPSGGPLPVAAAPSVEVVSEGRTSYRLRVTGADVPFWLVLGQSNSPGWHATVRGDDLGEPVIVDGYANGWRIDRPGGAFEVALTWTPQRTVWIGIWSSVVAALACLAIVVVSWRRRSAAEVVAAPVVLRSPWWSTGAPAPWRSTALAAVGVGVASALVVHPPFGLVAMLVTVAALRLPRGRAIGMGALVLVVAAAVFTIGKQWRNGYPADFGWADFFRPAHDLAWGALWLLVVTLLTDRLRSSTDKSQGPPLDAHSPPPG